MNNSRTKQVLNKIVTHIDHTLSYCEGQSFESFMSNRMLQEACVFNILQIGELAHSGLDSEFTNAHPEIAWHQIYGLRNRIVHDYEGIIMKIVWDTIKQDFPPLKDAIMDLMK